MESVQALHKSFHALMPQPSAIAIPFCLPFFQDTKKTAALRAAVF